MGYCEKKKGERKQKNEKKRIEPKTKSYTVRAVHHDGWKVVLYAMNSERQEETTMTISLRRDRWAIYP